MRIVRCIGKALGFKADGATTRIHSAMHAREARQIIAGVHDKPRLCGIDLRPLDGLMQVAAKESSCSAGFFKTKQWS